MTITSNYFLFINIFIIFVYVLCMYLAYKNGFIYELVNFVFVIVSFALAYFLAPIFSSLFTLVKLEDVYEVFSPFVNMILWFVIILVVLKIVHFFIVPLFKGLTKIPLLGSINKLLGIVFGFLNATLIVLVLSFLLLTPVFENGREIKDNTLFKYVETITNKAVTYAIDNVDIEKFFNEDIDIDLIREEFKEWLIEQTDRKS